MSPWLIGFIRREAELEQKTFGEAQGFVTDVAKLLPDQCSELRECGGTLRAALAVLRAECRSAGDALDLVDRVGLAVDRQQRRRLGEIYLSLIHISEPTRPY